MPAKRIVPPTFFPVPAGTAATPCPGCGESVYEIEAAAPNDKRAAIDCQVVGGRTPTGIAAGSGVLHWIYCTASVRATRRPA